MTRGRVLSPVLLVGAGTGEATCGILYLASYLRRGGIEAFVRLYDTDDSPDAITRSLEGLLARVRPRSSASASSGSTTCTAPCSWRFLQPS